MAKLPGGGEIHGRIHLQPEGTEFRVDRDGLFKGYIKKQLPGEGGGWFWRRIQGGYGEQRTKRQAMRKAADL